MNKKVNVSLNWFFTPLIFLLMLCALWNIGIELEKLNNILIEAHNLQVVQKP